MTNSKFIALAATTALALSGVAAQAATRASAQPVALKADRATTTVVAKQKAKGGTAVVAVAGGAAVIGGIIIAVDNNNNDKTDGAL